MSMKYEYLEQLKRNFIEALQAETAKATNEDDFSDLEDIAEDVLNMIPTELLQSDYITRTTIAGYIDPENTQEINQFMQKVSDDCVFHLDDETVCDDLQYCASEFIEQQNKKGE